MSRPLRRELADAFNSVTSRGDRREDIYLDDSEGRFKAILVDEDNYLLELAWYVVLNPVRAGVVQEAKDWPISSMRVFRPRVHRLAVGFYPKHATAIESIRTDS